MEKLKNLGYYNGTYNLIENMTVPMSDRVCWFADGVYDATATRNGVIYCLDDHVDRFFNSASMVEIEIPYTKDELKDLLKDLVSKVDTSVRMVKHFYTGRLQEVRMCLVIMSFLRKQKQIFG